MPIYRLQIVDDTDAVVMAGPPGARAPFELDLTARCLEAMQRRGVGLLKTEAQVLRACEEALDEVFRTFKADATGHLVTR